MLKRKMHQAAMASTLAVLFLAASCNSKTAQTAEAGGGAMPAMPVKIRIAVPVAVPDYTEYLSTLISRSASVLQPDVEGQLVKVNVKSGDRVKKGDLLFQIDPVRQTASLNSYEANVRTKKANLELAQKELERRKSLFAAGVISKQDLDQAQTAYDAAVGDLGSVEAVVKEQKVQLTYYNYLAPADGIIGEVQVRAGDRITPTTVLTTLDSQRDLEAYIGIPAEKAAQIHQGSQVQLLDASGKASDTVSVSYISPRVDTATQLLLIKADVPNASGKYKNEEQVRVNVIWSNAPQPMIPVLAVTRLGGQFFGFIAEPSGKDFIARQKALELGPIVGNDYVVHSGIKAGDRIIIGGTQVLADGMKVLPSE